MDTKYYILITKKDDGNGIRESDVIATMEFDAESTRDYVLNNNLKVNAEYYEFKKANGNIQNKIKTV